MSCITLVLAFCELFISYSRKHYHMAEEEHKDRLLLKAFYPYKIMLYHGTLEHTMVLKSVHCGIYIHGAPK